MPRSRRFRIIPLEVAKIKVWKAELTYNVDFSVQLWAPVFIYVLQATDSKDLVLVDAGFQPKLARSDIRGGLTQFKHALRMANIDPNKIRWLILTHLHSDHSSFLKCFPNARVFIQATELSYAHDPLPTQRLFYNIETLKRLEKADIETLNGDVRIDNGLRILHTPGHTPGSQTVLVDTTKGTYAICGDTVPMFHNWFPSNEKFGSVVELNRIPPGVHTDLHAWFNSARRIEKFASFVVPGHDPRLSDRKSLP